MPPKAEQTGVPEISIITGKEFNRFFGESEDLPLLISGLSEISQREYIEEEFVCANYAREAYLLINRLFGEAFEVKWFKIEDKATVSDPGKSSFSHAMVFIKRLSDGSILLMEPQSLTGDSYLIQNTQNDIGKEDIALVASMNQHLKNLRDAPTQLIDPTLTLAEVQ